MYHDSIDKKKHFTSGSRSKSKKSKPNDFSVDLKPHKVSQTMISHQHISKIKTQNSLNKSKGSRKKSKLLKKPKTKQSKEISRSISAQRKHTLSKINKTQANFDSEEYLNKRLTNIQKTLQRINKPKSNSTKEIRLYFQTIQDQLQNFSEPLSSFLCYMHELYLSQISGVLDLISPYEDLLKKKQQLSRCVQEQVKFNETIYSELDEDNIYILKLKQKIEQQRQQIQEQKKKKQEKRQRIMAVSENNMKKNKTSTTEQQEERQKGIRERQRQVQRQKQKQVQKQKYQNSVPNTKELKIDLGRVHKSQHMDYHEQFYSHFDEFSQSWRNQALRQKRY